jgi:hypothetical protein
MLGLPEAKLSLAFSSWLFDLFYVLGLLSHSHECGPLRPRPSHMEAAAWNVDYAPLRSAVGERNQLVSRRTLGSINTR